MTRPRLKSSSPRLLPFILVTSLFFFWGVANNMNDTLLAAFKRIMSMSDLQTSLVQSAFYGAYFCMAIPAALFIRRFNYKSGILLGLAVYAAGTMLFLPAGQQGSFPLFLLAIYVMAAGCAVLETTANPLVYSMGPAANATRRLNIAQMFNPMGAVCGVLLSKHLIFTQLHHADRSSLSANQLASVQQHEFSAISGTYFLIGCALLLLFCVICCVKITPGADSAPRPLQPKGGAVRLLGNRRFRHGLVAEFFYVGAQTCVWSYTIRLAMLQLNVHEASASNVFLCSIIAFTAFRFIFTTLMRRFRPVVLLGWAAGVAVLLTAMVILSAGIVSIVALVAISACMSLMFPTIYGIALGCVDEADTKIGGSVLIMSIVGGALITPLQGFVSDQTGSVSLSFIVPLVCFVIILIYSCHESRKTI